MVHVDVKSSQTSQLMMSRTMGGFFLSRIAFTSYLIIILVAGCFSAPADEPIRVDLPVYDQPQANSGVHLTQPLEKENHGSAARNENSLVGNLVSNKLQSVLGNNAGHGHVAPGIFSALPKTREDALLETEGWGSQTLSVKENIHNTVAGFFQPKPIVDTITEEEKYGNTGDKFYAAGRAVVGGAEGLSNFVNSALEIQESMTPARVKEYYVDTSMTPYQVMTYFLVFPIPGNIFKQITQAASEKLNNLGGKLIGL